MDKTPQMNSRMAELDHCAHQSPVSRTLVRAILAVSTTVPVLWRYGGGSGARDMRGAIRPGSREPPCGGGYAGAERALTAASAAAAGR
jgi:hypothetical protein